MTHHAPQKKIIIIGAGLGGLSAAISLATEGFAVELIEKNDKVGGKLNVLIKDGFTFDLGPSILTMPALFDALFTNVGKRREDYIHFQQIEPHWRNFFEDGSVVDLSADPLLMHTQLSQLDPKAPAEFARFMA
ncbi:MAG: NAD(P)-binding protein, partial [Methylovulum sp.]|nr:NAD(P)-binding protein [Methylovulum sp.]